MSFERLLLSVGVAAMFCISSAARADVSCTDPVPTKSGRVRGMSDDDTATCLWKGIPYAAPPTGELRWKSPEPAPSWSGVRNATEFGARCMQKGIGAWLINAVEVETSEDCLYLNVWRPKKSGTFPVMVWIHGGGFTIGAASDYNPDRLSRAGDVVVVTINYRLNIFGFIAHPGLREEHPHKSTGGYAILDMVAALKWIQENIEGFGGDPGNVTIFGESAGGRSVCTLMATPLAKGLFHRAIIESGVCDSSRELEAGYESARAAARGVGCGPDDLSCLRSASAEDLLDNAGGGSLGMGGFSRPHQDGYILTNTPLTMIREGNYNQVPFLAGYNRDEFAKRLKLNPDYYFTAPEEYEQKLVEIGFSEDEAKRIAELYPLSEFDNRPVEAYGRMFGADLRACGEYQGLLAAARQQQDTYFYRFDYDDINYGKYLGSFHGLEIIFVFDWLDMGRVYHIKFFDEDNRDRARPLARTMQGYWTNFAKNGNPNGLDCEGQKLPDWPMFKPDSQTIMVLDAHVRAEPADDIAEKCAFWQGLAKENKATPYLDEL